MDGCTYMRVNVDTQGHTVTIKSNDIRMNPITMPYRPYSSANGDTFLVCATQPWGTRATQPWVTRATQPWVTRATQPWVTRATQPWGTRATQPWGTRATQP